MSAAREITLHFEISGAPSGNPHLPTRNLAAGVGLARVKSSQFPDRFLTSKLATSAWMDLIQMDPSYISSSHPAQMSEGNLLQTDSLNCW